MTKVLRYGIWVWCILAVPVMLSWCRSTGWYAFMGFSGLALSLLTSQRTMQLVRVGNERKAAGDPKEEDQLDGSS